MTVNIKDKITELKQKYSIFIARYGIGGASLILSVELIWAASVIIPVLAVLGALFNATNAWMAVLPGFLGAISFLIVLAIGGLAATLPATYLAKWREVFLLWMERRYPEPVLRQPVASAAPIFPHGLDIQDAD